MTTLRIPSRANLQVRSWPPGTDGLHGRPYRLALGRSAYCIGFALALFAGLVVLPRLGLYRPVTVLSGTMRPTFSPGDMVIGCRSP